MYDQLSIFGDSERQYDTASSKAATYDELVDKFKSKLTTDDCYTPPAVYDAVAEYVSNRYNLSRDSFVRPFYPGGDYEHYEYKSRDVVVDNPPFSLSAKIYKFYVEHGIKFFLFAPALTLFSSSAASCSVCYIGAGASITYENGASVNTSFVTNLEPPCARSDPELYEIIDIANKAATVERATKAPLPKYSYPDNVLTAAALNKYSKYGISIRVPAGEMAFIRELDSQREKKKAVFGSGFLISERAAAERAAAERAAAERAAAIKWQLSDRELKIIAGLSSTKNE